MILWIRNFSFLLFVASAFGNAGLLSGEIYRLLAVLSLIVFLLTFGGALKSWRASRADAAPETRELFTYVVALAVVVVLAGLNRLFPVLWYFKSELAALQSSLAELIAREDRNLGPTAMALPALVSLIALAVVREWAAGQKRPARALLIVVVLYLVHLFYVVGLRYYAYWIANHRPAWEGLLLNSQHVFLLLGSAAYTLLDRSGPKKALAFFPGPGRRAAAAPLALALVTGAAAALLLGWAGPPQRANSRVMIYDGGFLNWNVPVHGVYGEHSAGMFGMLPSALQAVGFDVVVTDDLGALDAPDPPDCVVMINIQAFFEDEDKKSILDYVARGGGLLCLGDHTGVAGIRGPFNDILAPVGIEFVFDSATFFGSGWNDALECRVHPVNVGVASAEDLMLWVGASLEIDASARPVVVGRYGYSDIGDPANIQRAYLGNRRYDPSELLGDIVLVAEAGHGEGKVMVFGDTSGFQNLSLARGLDYAGRTIAYLSGDGGGWPGPRAQVGWLVLFIIFVLAASAWAGSFVPFVAAAVGLWLGTGLVTILNPPAESATPKYLEAGPEFKNSPSPHVRRDLAVIDFSHGGRYTLHAWQDKSIGGLEINLARCGYLPLIKERFPDLDPADVSTLVIIAPVRSYDGDEIDEIETFVEGGGRAIVTVGYEEFDGARELLHHFGLSVANVPLGRFETAPDSLTGGVRFHEAWPVLSDGSREVEVLLSKWDLPLAVRVRTGKGEIVVIGDSSFFYDVNLETREEYYAANVEFLRGLIEKNQAGRAR